MRSVHNPIDRTPAQDMLLRAVNELVSATVRDVVSEMDSDERRAVVSDTEDRFDVTVPYRHKTPAIVEAEARGEARGIVRSVQARARVEDEANAALDGAAEDETAYSAQLGAIERATFCIPEA